MNESSTQFEIYPWLVPLWETLSAKRDTLNHALLFSGLAGLGKIDFAFALADLLLCMRPGTTPCGECQVCKLGMAGTLPDLHVVTSQAHGLWLGGRLQTVSERYSLARDSKARPSERLRIDQIRQLLDNIIGTPHIARYRVAIIAAADHMNESAANALLKMLEEPPAGTWFVLVSDAPEKLPATIRSRCVHFKVAAPAHDAALQWLSQSNETVSPGLLSLAAGGPLQAKRLAQTVVGQKTDQLVSDYLEVIGGTADPVTTAAGWPGDECPLLLRLLQTVVSDLIRIRTDSQTEYLALPRMRDRLQAIGTRLDLLEAHGVYFRLTDSVRIYDIALNSQLLLEDLLIRSTRMTILSGTGNRPQRG